MQKREEIAFDNTEEIKRLIAGNRIVKLCPIFEGHEDLNITITPPPVISKNIILALMEISNSEVLDFYIVDSEDSEKTVRVTGPSRESVPDIKSKLKQMSLKRIINAFIPTIETRHQKSVRERAEELEKRPHD